MKMQQIKPNPYFIRIQNFEELRVLPNINYNFNHITNFHLNICIR